MEREAGVALLAKVREDILRDRFSHPVLPLIDIHIAMETARAGDLDGAIDQSRAVVDDLFNSGEGAWTALPTTVLVEALVQRGAEGDLQEAQAAIDRLAEISTEFPFEVPLLRLRALVARAGRRGWLPGVRGSAIGRWRRRSASRGIWRWPPP